MFQNAFQKLDLDQKLATLSNNGWNWGIDLILNLKIVTENRQKYEKNEKICKEMEVFSLFKFSLISQENNETINIKPRLSAKFRS